MLINQIYETVVRICIAYAAIISGTILLFAGITNTTADGEPFSYPFWTGINFLFWSMPSMVAAIYLFLGKNLRVLSWGFTGFCCYWLFSDYKYHANKDFKFNYWHQGDVFCTACDNSYFSLSVATLLFGLCAFVGVLARPRHGAKFDNFRLWVGVAAGVLLLFSTFVIGIS
jgi:hypothetical protein